MAAISSTICIVNFVHVFFVEPLLKLSDIGPQTPRVGSKGSTVYRQLSGVCGLDNGGHIRSVHDGSEKAKKKRVIPGTQDHHFIGNNFKRLKRS